MGKFSIKSISNAVVRDLGFRKKKVSIIPLYANHIDEQPTGKAILHVKTGMTIGVVGVGAGVVGYNLISLLTNPEFLALDREEQLLMFATASFRDGFTLWRAGMVVDHLMDIYQLLSFAGSKNIIKKEEPEELQNQNGKGELLISEEGNLALKKVRNIETKGRKNRKLGARSGAPVDSTFGMLAGVGALGEAADNGDLSLNQEAKNTLRFEALKKAGLIGYDVLSTAAWWLAPVLLDNSDNVMSTSELFAFVLMADYAVRKVAPPALSSLGSVGKDLYHLPENVCRWWNKQPEGEDDRQPLVSSNEEGNSLAQQLGEAKKNLRKEGSYKNPTYQQNIN